MLLDGEKRLAASQEEPEATVTTDHMALHAHNNTNTNNHNTKAEKANTSHHSRVFSPEGWKLVFSPPQLYNFENFLQNYLLTYFLNCIYIPSDKAEEEKRKPKVCLVLPGYMQKLKKSINLLKTNCLVKISSRSARFKRLADKRNICIVYENEPSLKKLICRTKISK